MNDYVALFLFGLLCFIAGAYSGYQSHLIAELRAELKPKPKPKAGVTRGAYKKVDEASPDYHSPGPAKKSGVVSPKSPQRVQWEADEERRKTSSKWGISPPKQGL